MSLSPAPHPPSVFRYLKQAWRDYIGTGGAQTLAVAGVGNHAANTTTTVSGTLLIDASIPPPVPVQVQLTQSATVKATQTAYADAVTGNWSTVFPANTLVAGTATATATTPYGAPVTTAAFTLT